MKCNFLAACAAIWVASTSIAEASVFNIVGSFDGGALGPVSFDVTIDADFSADIGDTTSGLTINSLSMTPDGGLGYFYISSVDRLNIGGLIAGAGGVLASATDFVFSIGSFTSAPTTYYLSDSSSSTNLFGQPTTSTLTVTNLTTPSVPLPAGFPLLLGAIGGFALVRRRGRA